MEVTRTFHPIGQGAFYSESFEDKQNKKYQPHLVVYDCGSEQEKKLQQYLEDYLYEDPKQTIDAVFISHLHCDHINGLPILLDKAYVKKIYLPLLTPNKIVEAFLFNKAFFSKSESNRANSIIQNWFLGLTNGPLLVTIKETSGESAADSETYNIDDERIQSIPNGAKIVLNLSSITNSQSLNPAWVYIPFNLAMVEPTIHEDVVNKIDNEKERDNVLSIAQAILGVYQTYVKSGKEDNVIFTHELLRIIDSKYEDFSSHPLDDYIEDEFAKGKGVDILRKVYRVLFGKIDNSQSMTVFSGLRFKDRDIFDIIYRSNILRNTCLNNYWHCHHGRCDCMCHSYCEEKIPCNFLYMGDFEAKVDKNVKALKDFYTQEGVWNTLCGIQIPHHGSRKNFNYQLYDNRCFAVASAGVNGGHNHPNIDTTINITNQGCCPNVVTEDINTLKYQHFNIK